MGGFGEGLLRLITTTASYDFRTYYVSVTDFKIRLPAPHTTPQTTEVRGMVFFTRTNELREEGLWIVVPETERNQLLATVKTITSDESTRIREGNVAF